MMVDNQIGFFITWFDTASPEVHCVWFEQRWQFFSQLTLSTCMSRIWYEYNMSRNRSCRSCLTFLRPWWYHCSQNQRPHFVQVSNWHAWKRRETLSCFTFPPQARLRSQAVAKYTTCNETKTHLRIFIFLTSLSQPQNHYNNENDQNNKTKNNSNNLCRMSFVYFPTSFIS
jgi:hypothetical protein